jgi:mucosal vascular addressin cell adhesion protein 1
MLLLAHLILLTTVYSYNIDILDPIPLSGKSSGEYFGYSSALQRSGSSRWLLVGAPTANVSLRDGTTGEGWGAVYNCSEGDKGYRCQELVLDDVPAVDKEIKQGQWTGVTLSVDPVNSDAITCAHR